MIESRDHEREHFETPLERRFKNVVTPFQEFVRDQTTGSVLLILCTLVALGLANSPLAGRYESLIDTRTGLIIGDWSLTLSVRHWVNDGLMSLFFFVLGLEIKREILVGELREPRQSLPVVAAAIGGMLVPASIFYAFNTGSDAVHGWGIPMATDTAFAVGVLALLRRHIPPALTTFLTALAILDDLGAILVIAVFYTDTLSLPYLELAFALLGALVICNILGIRRSVVYIIGGGLVWAAMLGSGVHATVAGVLVAMTVPARPKAGPGWFLRRTRRLLDEFQEIERHSERPILGEERQHAVVEGVQDTAEKATTPLRRWEHLLEYPVALLVMPVFALVNAGIPIEPGHLPELWNDPLTLGIVLGLVLGKSIGITFMGWLALRLGLGRLPANMHLGHITGIGLLGGMGFTMSIFIAGLSFGNHPDTLVAAKTAILLASLIAGVSGYLWLRWSSDAQAATNRNP
ncbi:MAG: Na+/H+ antiporter NhaA [Gammaproteobacteria bacterium]|jgi:NhaA family Na+:H+ antiporter